MSPFRSSAAFALLLATTPAAAQAVLGPTEDATVAPAGAARFRLANSWQHYNEELAGANAQTQSYVQVRFTTLTAEFGVLHGLSALIVVPEAGTLVNTNWYSQYTSGQQLDSIVRSSHNGIGDLELGAKFAWLAGPGELERIALSPGLHVRSAVSASYRFATGKPPEASDQFGIATGSGRTAVSAASQTDVMFGRAFWLSAVGRYLWPGNVARQVQVYPPSDPLSPSYGVMDATVSGGKQWILEATPRVVLGRYFALGAQYAYLHRDASHFVGTKDTVIAADTVHIDASTLDSATAGTAQYLSGTITYSTVAAYLQGRAGFPIEISYQYTATITSTGSLAHQAATNSITFRLWTHLWGSAFRKGKP